MATKRSGPPSGRSTSWRWLTAILVCGILAGLVGWFFKQVMHVIEHFAFGVSQGQTLLEAASDVPGWRRLVLVITAGVLGAVSWYLMRRSGRSPVAVKDAVDGFDMPVGATLWHALNQVVLVAMGASIGREVAPREMSAALATKVSRFLHLSPEDRRIIVGCAAGAGLAGVYSVPLSGAVFSLEILLVTLKSRAVWSAAITCALAVVIANGIGPYEPFFQVPELESSWSLALWSLIVGPIVGILGYVFSRVVQSSEDARPINKHLLWTMPLGFAMVGVVALFLPEVLGNGQPTTQSAFDAWNGDGIAGSSVWFVALGLIALVTLARLATTLITIRCGAWGGVLNPGIALGAGVGAFLGIIWIQFWNAVIPSLAISADQLAAFVFIGAAAFLGSSMKAPLTALFLVIEFTHQGTSILVPAVLAVGGSIAGSTWISSKLDSPPGYRSKTED